MMAVITTRTRVQPFTRDLARIRALAESCTRQLVGWAKSIEAGPVQGKRHLAPDVRARRDAVEKDRAFRLNWLKNLKPDHPLYRTDEARVARGEKVED